MKVLLRSWSNQRAAYSDHHSGRSVLHLLNIKKGLEIHYQGDLQKNSGLGTSSSFCVGLLNSLSVLENKKLSNKELSFNVYYDDSKLLDNIISKGEEMLGEKHFQEVNNLYKSY